MGVATWRRKRGRGWRRIGTFGSVWYGRLPRGIGHLCWHARRRHLSTGGGGDSRALNKTLKSAARNGAHARTTWRDGAYGGRRHDASGRRRRLQ